MFTPQLVWCKCNSKYKGLTFTHALYIFVNVVNPIVLQFTEERLYLVYNSYVMITVCFRIVPSYAT